MGFGNIITIENAENAITLILNASPDANLLNQRARTLNGAGYYTSSAHTAEEALRHAATMDCTLALICYSFIDKERKTLFEQLRKLSPRTKIVCLNPELDKSQHILVSRVEQALVNLSAPIPNG